MLRAAGVSGNKIKSFKDLAAKTLDGTVPTHAAIKKLSDAEIIERLTAVRGIGAWTVEMLLIFRLGRPDVLPVADYGVRKGYALTFMQIPKARALAAADLPRPMCCSGEKVDAVPVGWRAGTCGERAILRKGPPPSGTIGADVTNLWAAIQPA